MADDGRVVTSHRREPLLRVTGRCRGSELLAPPRASDTAATAAAADTAAIFGEKGTKTRVLKMFHHNQIGDVGNEPGAPRAAERGKLGHNSWEKVSPEDLPEDWGQRSRK